MDRVMVKTAVSRVKNERDNMDKNYVKRWKKKKKIKI